MKRVIQNQSSLTKFFSPKPKVQRLDFSSNLNAKGNSSERLATNSNWSPASSPVVASSNSPKISPSLPKTSHLIPLKSQSPKSAEGSLSESPVKIAFLSADSTNLARLSPDKISKFTLPMKTHESSTPALELPTTLLSECTSISSHCKTIDSSSRPSSLPRGPLHQSTVSPAMKSKVLKSPGETEFSLSSTRASDNSLDAFYSTSYVSDLLTEAYVYRSSCNLAQSLLPPPAA
ncbi:unnamed protein product [Protopolystoma xenopodis]|uniref:Uncharacterized protein n=1 Tax=Protopolystoma xenopodis TaxID=117903 RepID=A0A3S5BBU9_9PLAT|nr:unnamed protein product [Protopolystoma xenopodis]